MHLEPHDPSFRFIDGSECSVLQPAVRLQQSGYDCHIVDGIEVAGIYVVHPDFLHMPAFREVDAYVVSHRNDRPHHPEAQCEIVHNPVVANITSEGRMFFIPHYHEQDIVPRNHAKRQSCIENNFIGNNKRRIKTHPELANQIGVFGLVSA